MEYGMKQSWQDFSSVKNYQTHYLALNFDAQRKHKEVFPARIAGDGVGCSVIKAKQQ